MSPQRLSVNEIIKQIRARIVRRRLAQGVVITLAVAAVSLISAAILANQFSHKRVVLMVLRIVPIVLTVAAAWWFVFRTWRQRISDMQIARLVEEKFSLDDRVTTAVEFGEQTREASPAIVNRLVKDADERVSRADLNQVVDPRHAYAYGATAGAILLAMVAALWWLSPVKGGVSALYSPFEETVSANAMFINVTPVTSRVPRGSDQKIKAALNGFDTQVAQVFIRKFNDTNWLATAMEPAKNKGEFQHLIFNIQDSVVYYVEANGIRSSEQTLEVVDLPYVKQVDLILNFPTFTGLPAKKIENGGDVAALKGTVVRVTAILSAKAKAARIILSDGSKLEMTPDVEMTADNEFHFVGQFTVKETGTYKIELTSEDGERYNGSNEYDITLLEDAPPSVVIDKPGRDMKVSNIQEIFMQAKAEDDFGVSSIEFFYMVNGGEEKRVALQDLKRDAPKTLSGAHTFFLEEMGLQVGDFISYYAKAKDVTGQESTSDIYFLEVRPFDREFRQSQQQGAQGGGEGEQDSNALTKKQREIIAATFRVQREEKQYSPPEKDENFGAVALSQEKLKSEADALVDRIRRRLGERLNSDPKFSKLVEYVAQAATEMDAAKDKLRDKNTKEALPPEQRALQQLLRAEALFREIQVGQQQGQGGQGGQQDQKELADLFELQLDKMKNQYETVQRGQQQSQSQQQDELARKLQELAQRQQKELEQRMRSQMQQQGGSGGGGQRQQQEMIEEAQRMARELERLSRDRRDPKMQQAAEQMRQAAEEMKRAQALSSASQSQAAQAESAAQTQRALQRMEQARRMLNSSQQAGGQQNVQQLRQRAEDAMRRQNDISKSVDELAKNGQAGSSDKKQQLTERKQTLAEQMSGLEKDIDQAARGFGSDKQQAADKLRDAANAIRRNRIPERIKQNNQLIDNGYFAQAGEREKIIKENIEEVLKNLQAAESGANRPKGEGMEEALNRARELTENLESLRRRMEQGGAGEQQNQGQQQARQQPSGQQNPQQGQQANQPGRQPGRNQQGGQQQGNQPSRDQQGQQARGGQQGNQQQGNQPGQQPGQQARGQQPGQQQGPQQGQPSGRQQGQQTGGQQQGGQQQGGQQGGQQARGGQQQSNQPSQQSSDQRMQGGGGPPRTSGDRQIGSELQQRLNEAQELRRALRGNNDLTRDLDRAIDQLRRINPNAFDDPAQMALLKSEVIDPLRQLEVELARRLQGKLDNKGIGTLSDGDAPDRYRKLIEEYYRRLSSRSAGTKP